MFNPNMQQQPQGQGQPMQQQPAPAGGDISERIAEYAAREYEIVTEEMRNAETPDDAVRTAGVLTGIIVATMVQDAMSKGKQIPPPEVQKAMKTVVQDVVEIGHKIGAIPAQSQEEINDALRLAINEAGRQYVMQRAIATGKANGRQ